MKFSSKVEKAIEVEGKLWKIFWWKINCGNTFKWNFFIKLTSFIIYPVLNSFEKVMKMKASTKFNYINIWSLKHIFLHLSTHLSSLPSISLSLWLTSAMCLQSYSIFISLPFQKKKKKMKSIFQHKCNLMKRKVLFYTHKMF